MIRLATILFLMLGIGIASAQGPVITQPYAVNSSNASSTITATNVFQSIWAASTASRGRASCTVQNNGANSMWVYFGPIANATKAASVVVVPGSYVSCTNGGVVLQDQVSITGTIADGFFAAQQ